MKILTIGGATQDVFLQYGGTDIMSITKHAVQSTYMLFKSGEKIEIENLIYQTGGGATNSAFSFNRLGVETTCFCNVGDDQAGAMIIEALKNENIKTNLINKDSNHETGLSFIVNSIDGDSTIFAYRGANSHLNLTHIPQNSIKNFDQLYITSLSYNSSQILPEIVSQAKKNQSLIAINPGSSQLKNGTKKLKESLEFIDILILNKLEAQVFMFTLMQNDLSFKNILCSDVDQDFYSIQKQESPGYLLNTPLLYENTFFSLRKFFKAVLDMGPKIVVVTDGKNGVYASTKELIYFHPSLKINPINSVGAGDAFGSCFVATIALGFEINEALKFGIINSASVLQKIGAKSGLLTLDELKRQIKKIPHNQLQTIRH